MRKVPKLRFKEFTDEWEEKKLGECVVYKKGYAFKSEEFIEKGIRIIRVSDLGEKSIKNNEKVYIDNDKYNLYKEWEIKENDIILTTVGSRPPLYSSMVGKPILVVNKREICFLNQNSVLLRSKNTQLQKVIFNMFLKKKYINHIENIARGNANQANITLDDLFEYKINIPTFLPEQEKIAKFLSSVDKKISLTEEKLELFKEYKKGVMQKIFSQELRFKDNEGNDYPKWKEKRLEECIKKGKAGGTPKTTQKNFYENGKVKFLSISDMTSQGKYIYTTEKYITEEGVKNSSTWKVPVNSLIYSMYASVGFVSINKVELSTSQAMFSMVPNNNISLEYLYYYLSYLRNFINKFIERGTQGNLSAETIKNFIIQLPELEEQEKIANFLSSIDTKIENIEKELENLKEFKKGLLQQMFV